MVIRVHHGKLLYHVALWFQSLLSIGHFLAHILQLCLDFLDQFLPLPLKLVLPRPKKGLEALPSCPIWRRHHLKYQIGEVAVQNGGANE